MRKLCFVVLSLLFFLLAGCISPKKIEYVPYEVPGKVEYISKVIKDSIYLSEKEYLKGDTVYLTKYEYHLKLRTDTIRDSIPYPVPTPVYVDKEVPVPYVPALYKILAVIGIAVIAAFILKLIIKKGI